MNSARRLTFPWHGISHDGLFQQLFSFTVEWTEWTIGSALIRFLLETCEKGAASPTATEPQSWPMGHSRLHFASLQPWPSFQAFREANNLIFQRRSWWVISHLTSCRTDWTGSVWVDGCLRLDPETPCFHTCRFSLRLLQINSWQILTKVSGWLETVRKLFCFPQSLMRSTFPDNSRCEVDVISSSDSMYRMLRSVKTDADSVNRYSREVLSCISEVAKLRSCEVAKS